VITPSVKVGIVDNQGNVVTSSTNTVTLAFGSNPGGATLGGTLQVPAVSGVATFTDLSIPNAANNYTLSASAGGFSPLASGQFNITSGSAKALKFVTQPATTTAGANASPAVTVKIVDSVGVTVTSSNASITLSLGANPGSGTLAGTLTVTATNGVATFSAIRINHAGAGYTLAAASGTLSPDTSAAFTINAGAASILAFVQQPTNVAAASIFSPIVLVAIQDGQGNTITAATNTVTLAISGNPGGSTLGGTAQVSAVAGVATFSNISLNKSANNYTLSAGATGLTGATSSAFNVSPGAPAALKITTQPVTVNVGATMPSVVVTVRDASGNTVTSATNPVTLSFVSNTPGATLGGTPTIAALSGLATFADLTLDKPGQGFTLRAAASGLTPDTSAAFNAIGPVTQLVFTQQPTSTIRNGAIAPPMVIEARDAAASKVTAFTGAVTLSIGNNPASGSLGGTTWVNAIGGIATLGGVSVSAAGTGYTLVASIAGNVSATSNGFDITSFGPASKLAFIVQPTNADASAAINPAVQVVVQDVNGNQVTNSTAAITMALGNPGSATLGGTVTISATGGIASFSDLTVSAAGIGYTLIASGTQVSSTTSSPFVITVPGAAQRLRFDVQPSNTTAGQFFFPSIVVSAVNSANAIVTSATGTITLSVDSGPPGATLNSQVSLLSGQATFSSTQLTVAGVYHLRATGASLSPGVSQAFTISPNVANKLAFLAQPANTTAGRLLPQSVVVDVEDQFGNRIPAAGNPVRISLSFTQAPCYGGFQPLTSPIYGTGVALDGDTIENAQSGVATFTTLRPRADGDVYRACAGAGYPLVLAASSAGLITTNSAIFTTTHAPASALAVFTQPNQSGQPNLTVIGRQPIGMTFIVVDSLGNLAATGGEVVTVSLSTNPAGAHLAGTTGALASTANAGTCCSAGQAIVSPAIDSLGTYVLTASSPGLTSVNTSPFNAVSSTAAQLGFVVLPANTKVATIIAPAVRVCALDPFGNEVHTATGSVVMSIGTNAGNATLSGTLTKSLSSGCANFSDLSLNAVGNSYTLRATASGIGGVTGAFSSPLPGFNITP
jgi:hypothetical protein